MSFENAICLKNLNLALFCSYFLSIKGWHFSKLSSGVVHSPKHFKQRIIFLALQDSSPPPFGITSRQNMQSLWRASQRVADSKCPRQKLFHIPQQGTYKVLLYKLTLKARKWIFQETNPRFGQYHLFHLWKNLNFRA